MADTLQVEIVTPEHAVVKDEVTEITVPGKKGYIGVLPGHAPLISELAVGEISYRNVAGQLKFLAVAWGFLEVLPDKVRILAEVAEKAEDIDVGRAEKARLLAAEALKQTKGESEYSKLEADLQRADTRIAVAKRLSSDVANVVP